MGKLILLTGLPGSGKTTVIERTLELLEDLKQGGFITREIRSHAGQRLGFEIRTLDGETAVLAHIRIQSPHRVGKYGVDIRALEQTGVAAIRRAIQDADFVVVDEIGKMELLSPAFREVMQAAVRSPKPALATIMLRSHPFADALKQMPDAEMRIVTPQSREALPAWAAERIRRALAP
ncbi:MAG: NTPase [Anaerolineae bacterium]|nr:NTPase [Anaerolineae bacterium]